ncbi:glycosyltransferase [Bradyrhizobium sp. CIR48]|uniref:glycosyltransferase n=1 Tax=Bradyrhizobium sp. CIR48 TaxID=2663840 RepID=UPI001FEFAA5B|nr:glycosyltransferase [Bradyrhizobium sp. CIR48]
MDPQRGGGTAERTRRLALSLAQLDCQCTVLTMGSTPWRRELEQAGVDVLSVIYLGDRYPLPLINVARLFSLFRRADIIHIMGVWFLLAAVSSVLGFLAGASVVLCPAGSLTRFGRDAWLKRFYLAIAGWWMLRTAGSIIATTRQEQELLVSDFGMPPSLIFISPNGIEAPQRPSQSAQMPDGRIILFLGRLVAIKAPDLLVEAFALVAPVLDDTILVFSGPDHGQQLKLENRVCELMLGSRVIFTGFIDEKHRTALLARTSVLVVPSHSEVMSMVALEAGAMGVPVIVSKKCGFPEVGEVGGGFVVDADSPALARALVQILSDDANRAEMGKRLQKFVLERFSWPAVAASLVEHFATLEK